MLRPLTAALLLALTVAPASASNLRDSLARNLRLLRLDHVDVDALSPSQVGQIAYILHSNDDDSGQRSRIVNVVEGGFLQRLIFGPRR